jgi:hypothetical protein
MGDRVSRPANEKIKGDVKEITHEKYRINAETGRRRDAERIDQN